MNQMDVLEMVLPETVFLGTELKAVQMEIKAMEMEVKAVEMEVKAAEMEVKAVQMAMKVVQMAKMAMEPTDHCEKGLFPLPATRPIQSPAPGHF